MPGVSGLRPSVARRARIRKARNVNDDARLSLTLSFCGVGIKVGWGDHPTSNRGSCGLRVETMAREVRVPSR